MPLPVARPAADGTSFRPARLIHNAHTASQPSATTAKRRRSSTGFQQLDTLQSVTAVLFLRDAFTVVTSGATDGSVS